MPGGALLRSSGLADPLRFYRSGTLTRQRAGGPGRRSPGAGDGGERLLQSRHRLADLGFRDDEGRGEEREVSDQVAAEDFRFMNSSYLCWSTKT